MERNYKKIVDNNAKTGRGRKIFEFEAQFNEIYSNKVNIRPEILLTSSSEIIPNTDDLPIPQSTDLMPNDLNIDKLSPTPNSNLEIPTGTSTVEISNRFISYEKTPKSNASKRNAPQAYRKRNEILVEMKMNLKEYYNKKLDIENKKLDIAHRKLLEKEKRTALLEKYLQNVDQKDSLL